VKRFRLSLYHGMKALLSPDGQTLDRVEGQ
jgi:hypothetical protein